MFLRFFLDFLEVFEHGGDDAGDVWAGRLTCARTIRPSGSCVRAGYAIVTGVVVAVAVPWCRPLASSPGVVPRRGPPVPSPGVISRRRRCLRSVTSPSSTPARVGVDARCLRPLSSLLGVVPDYRRCLQSGTSPSAAGVVSIFDLRSRCLRLAASLSLLSSPSSPSSPGVPGRPPASFFSLLLSLIRFHHL